MRFFITKNDLNKITIKQDKEIKEKDKKIFELKSEIKRLKKKQETPKEKSSLPKFPAPNIYHVELSDYFAEKRELDIATSKDIKELDYIEKVDEIYTLIHNNYFNWTTWVQGFKTKYNDGHVAEYKAVPTFFEDGYVTSARQIVKNGKLILEEHK